MPDKPAPDDRRIVTFETTERDYQLQKRMAQAGDKDIKTILRSYFDELIQGARAMFGDGDGRN